jgi:hypothetical protein
MRGSGTLKGTIGGLLFVVGAVLLIVSLLSVWYVFSETESSYSTGQSNSNTVQDGFRPGSSYTDSSSSSCSGLQGPGCPSGQSASCPYSGGGGASCPRGGANQTGRLYLATEYVLIGGIVMGLIGAVLAILSPGRPGLWRGAMALGILALLFALIAPMTLFALQPGALSVV